MAAGIDPQKMRREPSWSRERVIEEILTRTLRNEPVQRRLIHPRALAEAGTRIFGSWKAALTAAGVDVTASTEISQTTSTPVLIQATPILPDENEEQFVDVHRPKTPWTDIQILTAIKERLHARQDLYATAVYAENRGLYRAATRRYGNWKSALIASGLDPLAFRKPIKRQL